MAAADVAAFLRRAEDFARGMKLLKTDVDDYKQSVALLAVHAAIAYSDALRSGLGNTSLSSQDHSTAVQSLRQVLPQNSSYDIEIGLNHLKELLSRKTAIAYGNQQITIKQCEALKSHSERFAAWANRVGIAQQIAGWSSDYE